MKKNVKICFAASSGGHFEQIMMLKPLMEKYDSFIITERTAYKATQEKHKIYYVGQINRKELLFAAKLLVNAFQSTWILLKERPDLVICTGALATVPICRIAKFFGKKLIYIESFAKVTSPTMSGKHLYKYADQFYVQWESMKEIYPDAIYLGGIY